MNAPETLAPTTRDLYREQFVEIAPTLAGARLPWLARARTRAFERYAAAGLPTLRDEDWKYTSVAALEKRAFNFAAGSPGGVDPAQLASLALPGCARLVFVNGRHAPALSQLGALPQGVAVGSLAAALAARPERFESWLGGAAETPGTGFTALNAALWADGACIELAPGTALEAPLQLLFITTRGDLAVCPRNLIHLGAGAHAEIVEQHVDIDEAAYFTNAYTEIVLERGATLTHSKLQQESRRAWHIADIRALQGRDSRFTSQSFALGGLLSRCDIATRLDAEGCEATLLGLYLADGRQHMDHHTRIDHARPHGTSRQLYKGMLDGAARAVFNGKVIVHPDAQGSDAQQSNRNLLLSPQAEVDTKPQLEIYADDVKCSHGATVGQLDAEQIFYLRTRGVDEASARALLTFAFAAEVVGKVGLAALRARLEALLRGRLPEQVKELL
jgi:Fe-S cluster assembly protein SufD